MDAIKGFDNLLKSTSESTKTKITGCVSFGKKAWGTLTQGIDSLKNVANTSSGSPGMLVQMAGAKGYSSEGNNTLSREVVSIEDRIEQLKSIYEKQKERYWKQFNTMEQVLANMSSQSSYIQSQFYSY